MRSSLMCPSHGNPYDYDPPDIRVIWERRPKAKKPHLCCVCDEEIAIGTVYENRGYYYEGEFRTEKHHAGAYLMPRGCPKFLTADIAAQEEAMRLEDNPYTYRGER